MKAMMRSAVSAKENDIRGMDGWLEGRVRERPRWEAK